ncbi:Ms4533A family Cys-rich leader peptide [Streptomyces sp. NPDC059649]
MPHRHATDHAAIELALIGVSVQSVADIDCR